jgi:hypothetical protein
VPGQRHSGKRGFDKNTAGRLPRVPRISTRGKVFLKKEFLPRVLHSGKIFLKKKVDGADGVKSSPSARAALGEGFPECTRFGTRGRPLPHEKRPR